MDVAIRFTASFVIQLAPRTRVAGCIASRQWRRGDSAKAPQAGQRYAAWTVAPAIESPSDPISPAARATRIGWRQPKRPRAVAE
ncbi:MAG TPA: hypothetical protein VEQ11_17060 [Chloroflexota bacterium]|nr:hypothetical protein [Chloroflexota bacterium]